jgi:signal transduction histidine kinase
MLTARSGADAAVEGYGAGADDFVPKPFHARVLLARVHAHLNLRSLALQLADHSRLALAGTLAAGVAHEVRNPVNAIINAGRVLADSAPDGMSRKLLEIIDQGAQRIVDIVAALDEHVRPSDGRGPSDCDLVAGIESSLDLLEYRTRSINVHRSYSTAPRVIGTVRELNQVFLNLLDNAVRAEPQNIWIEIEQSMDRTFITVADDGPGVADEIAQHVFDPFVTTRPVGEGTGLGLYLSRRIVEDHGGRLSLSRRAGGGAEFVIELPSAIGIESPSQRVWS